MRVMNHEWILW